MPKSSLRGYSDVYILGKGTRTVANTAVTATAGNNTGKKKIFKNLDPFTDWISKLNEFEKWRAIRVSVGSVGGVLEWVAWVACLRGWHVWCAYVGGVLVWLACLCGWCANVGYVGGVLAWVTDQCG